MRSQTTRCWYEVDRRQISYLKFILEAYDNVAVVSTLDAGRAVVEIAIASGCETLVKGIMHEMASAFAVNPVNDPATPLPDRANGRPIDAELSR